MLAGQEDRHQVPPERLGEAPLGPAVLEPPHRVQKRLLGELLRRVRGGGRPRRALGGTPAWLPPRGGPAGEPPPPQTAAGRRPGRSPPPRFQNSCLSPPLRLGGCPSSPAGAGCLEKTRRSG